MTIVFMAPPKCPQCGAPMVTSFLEPDYLVCTVCGFRMKKVR